MIFIILLTFDLLIQYDIKTIHYMNNIISLFIFEKWENLCTFDIYIKNVESFI